MMIKKTFSIFCILLSFIQFCSADEYKVPQYAYGLDVCDIDNDGDIDIIVGSDNQGNDTISILLNDGYGNFTWSYFIRSNHTKIFCSCMNEDNLPDIVTRNSLDTAWVYYPNLESGTYGDSHIIYKILGQSIDLFNLDENNSPDFICYDQVPAGILGALYNNGSGSFSHIDIYSSPVAISEPDVGDVNGDSLNDILMTDSNGDVFIFLNEGAGLFNPQIVDLNPVQFTYIFDIDNDGDNDLGLYHEAFIGNEVCRLKIFENQFNDFVLRDTIFFPTGTKFKAFADFNNDNFFDIVYKRSTWDEMKDTLFVVFNNQDFNFSSPDRYFVNNPIMLKVIAADFDGNGYNDIAYTYYSTQDTVAILFNDGTGKFVENPLTSIENYDNKPIDFAVCPNPFNCRTRIKYNLDCESNIQISIYNNLGQLIETITETDKPKGNYSYEFEASELNKGIYFCTLIVNGKVGASMKMIVL